MDGDLEARNPSGGRNHPEAGTIRSGGRQNDFDGVPGPWAGLGAREGRGSVGISLWGRGIVPLLALHYIFVLITVHSPEEPDGTSWNHTEPCFNACFERQVVQVSGICSWR